jgi:hypothetical protein
MQDQEEKLLNVCSQLNDGEMFHAIAFREYLYHVLATQGAILSARFMALVGVERG